MKNLTTADVREIASTVSLQHAEFCIAQAESQHGSDAVAALWVELAYLSERAADEEMLNDPNWVGSRHHY